jgi:hypothetical protein
MHPRAAPVSAMPAHTRRHLQPAHARARVHTGLTPTQTWIRPRVPSRVAAHSEPQPGSPRPSERRDEPLGRGAPPRGHPAPPRPPRPHAHTHTQDHTHAHARGDRPRGPAPPPPSLAAMSPTSLSRVAPSSRPGKRWPLGAAATRSSPGPPPRPPLPDPAGVDADDAAPGPCPRDLAVTPDPAWSDPWQDMATR